MPFVVPTALQDLNHPSEIRDTLNDQSSTALGDDAGADKTVQLPGHRLTASTDAAGDLDISGTG